MSQKKRKADSSTSERPSKKQQTGSTVKVTHLAGADIAKPVVATSGGVLIPRKSTFTPYVRRNASGTSNLLLQSSDHDTIDYTAHDSNTTDSNEQYLKHYIAVFDPEKGQLEVTEARKMTLKSHVRQLQTTPESEDESFPTPAYASRAALTEAFGSKKSKKAVATMSENRVLAGTGADDSDPLSKALLSTLPDILDDPIEEPSASQSTKPLPPPNLTSSDINEAYSLSTLIIPPPHTETLSSLPTAHWHSRLTRQKSIKSNFRFLARYLTQLSHFFLPNAPTPPNNAHNHHLHLLKYIELLLLIHKHASTRTNFLPPPSQWPSHTTIANTPPHIPLAIYQHFFPDSRASDFNLTKLKTYILAIAIRFPPGLSLSAGNNVLAIEPFELYLDLGIDASKGNALYKELGAKIDTPKEMEISAWQMKKAWKLQGPEGVKKAEGKGGKVKIVRLSLPLEFPKVSSGRRLKARR